MIRLPPNQKITFLGPRRRRVSDQLAVVAALMLFASTQIASPERSGTSDDEVSADSGVLSVERKVQDESGKTGSEKPADALAAQVVSGKTRKDKGLDLSLFLLGR